MTAAQMTLTTIPAVLLEADTNKQQSVNYARAEKLGGAVICHRGAHRRGVYDDRPSESDQWVAYYNGVFQGVWYHAEQLAQFLSVRGWEIQK